jgi:hypothetical protein
MLVDCVQISSHRVWLNTLMDICRAEEQLQIVMNTFMNPMRDESSNNNLEQLCDNLAQAGSFYESSLIQMPVGDETMHRMTKRNKIRFLT